MAYESEQATPVDSIKDVVQSSVKVPEFDKHLKKSGGHIGRNVMEITMKTIVRKPFFLITCQFRFLYYLFSMLHNTAILNNCNKSNISNRKRDFFQSVSVSVLLNGCTT